MRDIIKNNAIDLNTGWMQQRIMVKGIVKKYIGGSGLADKYQYYEETDHESNPLGSEIVLFPL